MQARFFQFVLSRLDPHTLLIVRRITPVEHYQWKDSWAIGWASFVLSAGPALMCVLTYFVEPVLAYTIPFLVILSLIFVTCAVLLAFQASTIATTRIYPDALQLLALSHLSHRAILQGCLLSALAKMREMAAVLVALLPGFLMVSVLDGWRTISTLSPGRQTIPLHVVVLLYGALLPLRLLGMNLLALAIGVWMGAGRSAGPLPSLGAMALVAAILVGCEGMLLVGLQILIVQEPLLLTSLLILGFCLICLLLTAAPGILTWYLIDRVNPLLPLEAIRTV